MLSKGDYIKKSTYLECLDEVYKDSPIEYLVVMRDALTIIIRQRSVGGCKPYKDYFPGFIRYE